MTDRETRRKQYAQKLKDPRWQKKRLQILERDEWTCQHCFDSESTLHVHHKRYSPGDPWDTPDEWLVALCESCHDEETYFLQNALKDLSDVMRVKFRAVDISYLAHLMKDSPIDQMNAGVDILLHFLNSRELIEKAESDYSEHRKKSREEFQKKISSRSEGTD